MEMVRPKKRWDVREVLVLFKSLLASSWCITAVLLVQHDRCEKIEKDLIELKTIVQERIRIDRGDYGYDDPSEAPDIASILSPDIDWEKGERVRKQIDNFAD